MPRWDSPPGGGGALDDLYDVSASAPTDGQALVYNSSTGLWVPGTVSGGGGGGSTLIAEQVLASTSATIDFTSIPTTYRDLLMVFQLRSSRASSPNDDPVVYLGAGSVDTGSNYRQNLTYAGSTAGAVRSGASAGWRLTVGAAAATADATVRGAGELRILGYQDAGYKGALGTGGVYNNSSNQWTWDMGYGEWMNTGTVDRIRIASANGASWLAGSRAALYGVG